MGKVSPRIRRLIGLARVTRAYDFVSSRPVNVSDEGSRTSIKGPISVPVSPSNAVECYPCRRVTLNYNRSLLFHGGDTGSTPVRDAIALNSLKTSNFVFRSLR